MAFILHALSWLSENGTAAIVCFPGVMYRGGVEKQIRKYLVDYIDSIIQLPDNLFFGTTIATCIMVLKKNKTDRKILFIDASREFVKITNNNKLTGKNIEHIVEVFQSRQEKEYFSKLVDHCDIAAQDYNLSVSLYVEPEDTGEIIDINALNQEIDSMVAREAVLREEFEQIIQHILHMGK